MVWPFFFLFESSYRKPAFLILLPSFIELGEWIHRRPARYALHERTFLCMTSLLPQVEWIRKGDQSKQKKRGHEWRSSGPFTLFLVTRGSDKCTSKGEFVFRVTMHWKWLLNSVGPFGNKDGNTGVGSIVRMNFNKYENRLLRRRHYDWQATLTG